MIKKSSMLTEPCQSSTGQGQLLHSHSQEVKYRMAPQSLLDPKKVLATRHCFLLSRSYFPNYWHMRTGHGWTSTVPLKIGFPSKISPFSSRKWGLGSSEFGPRLASGWGVVRNGTVSGLWDARRLQFNSNTFPPLCHCSRIPPLSLCNKYVCYFCW